MDRRKDWVKDGWKTEAKSITQRCDAAAADADADADDDKATCRRSISRARDAADEEEERITGAAATTAAAAAACALCDFNRAAREVHDSCDFKSLDDRSLKYFGFFFFLSPSVDPVVEGGSDNAAVAAAAAAAAHALMSPKASRCSASAQ